MEIVNRLRRWSEIRDVRPAPEAPDAAGGRDGERLLERLVGEALPFKDVHVLAGRRIPSARQGRRREIDLIVCTPRAIHLIEVKNWSGRLDLAGNSWRQTRRGGDVVDHGDLLATNLQKRDAVVDYLRDRGEDLDARFASEHVVPKVVFMNPSLEVAPSIASRPEVVTRRALDAFLASARPEQGFVSRLVARLVPNPYAQGRDLRQHLLLARLSAFFGPSWGRDGRIPRDRYARIVALLSATETWDRLHVYGGRVVSGDVVGLKVGPKTYRRADLAGLTAGRPIRLGWTRRPLWGLLKALTGLGPLGRIDLGPSRLPLSPSDTVTFHAVGAESAAPVKLVEIDRIVLG